MKNQILKAIGGASLAILILVTLTQISVSAKHDNNGSVQNGSEQTLVGSWDVRVSIRDCQSGIVFFSFPAMMTYERGGQCRKQTSGILRWCVYPDTAFGSVKMGDNTQPLFDSSTFCLTALPPGRT